MKEYVPDIAISMYNIPRRVTDEKYSNKDRVIDQVVNALLRDEL